MVLYRDNDDREVKENSIVKYRNNKQVKYFAGKVGGTILTEKHGSEGFGYDPVFMPDGYDKSFAELGAEIKNRISHRAKAVKELVEYLSK